MIKALLMTAALLPQGPRVATIQLPKTLSVESVAMQDVDLDERTDLVLSCRDKESGVRIVQVHARQTTAPAFVSTPSRRYELDGSIVAFTFCDCAPNPGRELVLLTPTIAAAVITGPDDDADNADYRQLFRHTLIWPAPSPRLAMQLTDAVADLDADGKEDLVLPGPDRWTAWFQVKESFIPRHLQLPKWRSQIQETVDRGGNDSGGAFEMRFSGGRPTRAVEMLVQTSTRTPPCALLDVDKDGQLDLVAHRNGVMFTGVVRPQRALELQRRPLPLPENRLKLLDPSFDVQWRDVDGDGQVDLLLTTSANRDDEVEARVDLYLTQPDGSWPSKPSRRLRTQPMAQPAQLVDCDGDGREDLVCLTIRTASIAAMASGRDAGLEAQLTVFLNDGDGFGRRPQLNVALQLSGAKSRRQPVVRVRPGRGGMPGDVLTLANGRLERRLLAKRGDQLRLAAADAGADVPKTAQVEIVDRYGDDLLILQQAEVRHVRFRR